MAAAYGHVLDHDRHVPYFCDQSRNNVFSRETSILDVGLGKSDFILMINSIYEQEFLRLSLRHAVTQSFGTSHVQCPNQTWSILSQQSHHSLSGFHSGMGSPW
jgi:hypothetical protein